MGAARPVHAGVEDRRTEVEEAAVPQIPGPCGEDESAVAGHAGIHALRDPDAVLVQDEMPCGNGDQLAGTDLKTTTAWTAVWERLFPAEIPAQMTPILWW